MYGITCHCDMHHLHVECGKSIREKLLKISFVRFREKYFDENKDNSTC